MSAITPAGRPSARYPHLPPGRAPGRQSRRAGRARPFGLIVTALSGMSLIAGAIVILATTDLAQRKNVGLAAVLAAMAIPILALAVWLWRRSRNPQAKFVELAVDRPQLRRGDRVTATLRVLNAARVKGTLQVGLVCTELWDAEVHSVDSNGNRITSRATRRDELLADWHDIPGAAPGASMSFSVPADAPFSYEGDTVSWAWRVSARVQRPHHSDPHRDVPIWVSP